MTTVTEEARHSLWIIEEVAVPSVHACIIKRQHPGRCHILSYLETMACLWPAGTLPSSLR